MAIALPDGLLVVDVDPRNNGFASYDALASAPDLGFTETRMVVTGGGGAHFYYRIPAGLTLPAKLPGYPGIDLKRVGGYVLAPPSNHATGGFYSGAFIEPIADAPAWLVQRAWAKEDPGARAERSASSALSPGVQHKAFADALTPYFEPGDRHEMFREICGYMLKRGCSKVDALEVAEGLPAPDDDGDNRRDSANWVWDKANNPAGYTALVRRGVPPEVLARLEALVPEQGAAAQWASVRGVSPLPVPTGEQLSGEAARQHNPMPAHNETRSDLGNARRLVRMHGTNLRYCEARDGWYVWDGARWKYDDTGAAKRAAKASADSLWDVAKNQSEEWRKFAAASLNRGRIEAALALAQSEPGIPVTVDMLDADPWLLNVQNGTLDLRTGELRTPDRALLMTKSCATPYVPGARSALWDSFIARLTGGDAELAAYLQRALGYAVFGAWREKMFWFGYGDPDGGKSTFLGVVSEVLGDYAVAAAASTWMIQHSVGGNRGDITRLLGARLVTTLEVRPGSRFDPEVMKKATGGDKLTAAAKFENDIEFKPAFALWFGANDRPVIPDDDEGFWGRVRCVPFLQVIPKAEQDKALKEKLTGPEHAPAVLAWLVEGCLAWQGHGIGTCSAVEAATTAYRRDMNQAAGFFDECCELDPNGSVFSDELQGRYAAWCGANGVRRPLQGKAWRKRLLALGATGGDDASRYQGRRTWFGIRLRPS